MNKPLGSNVRRSLVITAIAGFLLMFAASTAVRAQGLQFKVGDRVEVDTLQSGSNPEKSFFWRPGIITGISDPLNHFGYYIIKIDDGRERNIRYIDTQWIRAAVATAGTPPPAETRSIAQPGGAGAAPANDNACQPSDNPDGKSQSDMFKRLIIAHYAHLPKNDRDFTTTVTFQSFKPGAMHKYRPAINGSPDGPGGHAGTSVYPAKAVYTVCSDYPGYKPTGYRGEIQSRQNELMFSCLKNEVGEWQCNAGEGKLGELKFIKK